MTPEQKAELAQMKIDSALPDGARIFICAKHAKMLGLTSPTMDGSTPNYRNVAVTAGAARKAMEAIDKPPKPPAK